MVSRGESKVGQLAGHAMVSNQNVFRLQVPVVNSNGVAVLDGIQDLEEGTLGKGFIPNILGLFCDAGEEITLGAVFHDNVCAVGGIHDLDQRNHVGVSAGLVMKLNLSLLELALARLKAKLIERLYSIGDVGLHVHGSVDDSIGTHSKDASQLQSSGKYLA